MILVTGGAGFIGSHLCERLIELGHSVRVVDNLSLGNQDWIPEEAEILLGDITDAKTCLDATEGVSHVFHLASMSKVAPSLDSFEKCTRQNILGTQNILIAARENKVKKVIYSASSTYYGNQPPPHHEGLLPDCLNPYAFSKYVGEQMCEVFTKLYDLSTLSLRYFNVYGPRQPFDGPYGLVMGIFLNQKKNQKPLTIHGDGSQRRDFIHVSDVVEANVKAMTSSAQGMALNIGTGESISVKDLANLISPHQTHESSRRGDAKETRADISKAREFLGWEPKIPIDSGILSLIKSGVAT